MSDAEIHLEQAQGAYSKLIDQRRSLIAKASKVPAAITLNKIILIQQAIDAVSKAIDDEVDTLESA